MKVTKLAGPNVSDVLMYLLFRSVKSLGKSGNVTLLTDTGDEYCKLQTNKKTESASKDMLSYPNCIN